VARSKERQGGADPANQARDVVFGIQSAVALGQKKPGQSDSLGPDPRIFAEALGEMLDPRLGCAYAVPVHRCDPVRLRAGDAREESLVRGSQGTAIALACELRGSPVSALARVRVCTGGKRPVDRGPA